MCAGQGLTQGRPASHRSCCLSSSVLADAVDDRDSVAALLGSHVFKGVTVDVTRGDYAPLMAAVVEHLTRAKVSRLITQRCRVGVVSSSRTRQ